MTDEHQRKRRVLIAIIAVVAVIGAAGVTISLLVGDDTSTPSGALLPTETFDPLSVEGQCRADHVATFQVAYKKEPVTALTATAAVEPWLRAGETSQTTSTGDTAKLVALGRPGKDPREVLTLAKAAQGWRVTDTAACLDQTRPGAKCAVPTLTVGGTSYHQEHRPEGAEPGVAAFVGQASLTLCVTIEGRSFASRGVIAPVTAYTANEQPAAEAVVIADDTATYLFVPAK